MSQSSYQNILIKNYEDRVGLDPHFSMRSYAKVLGMAPSTLSEVMRGKKGISPQKAASLVEALRLPDWEGRLFRDLVMRERGRNYQARSDARRRVKSQGYERKIELLKATALEALSSWIDLAILEATHLKSFVASELWLAGKLSVEPEQIRDSRQRLEAVGLLKVHADGAWQDVSEYFTTTDGVPSGHVRRLHSSLLRLAEFKLHNAETQDRTCKAAIFSVRESQLPEAKMILDQAIERIASLGEKSSDPADHVVCFSSQLFFLLKGCP